MSSTMATGSYTPTRAELAAHRPPTGTWADRADVVHYVAHISRAAHLDWGEDTPVLYYAEIVDPPLTEVGNAEPNLKAVGRSPERALYFLEKRIVGRTAKPVSLREVLYDESAQPERPARSGRTSLSVGKARTARAERTVARAS